MQLSPLEPEYAVACRGEPWVVRRDDRRQPLLRVHVLEQFVKGVSGGLVEITGRLVGEQQRRLHRERTRNRDALLFTT